MGSPAWFHFLELATVGGPFFISKEGLTYCQGGRHFDLLWGRAINPSKNILVRQHHQKITPKEVKKAEIKSETLRLHTVGCRAPRAKRRTDLEAETLLSLLSKGEVQQTNNGGAMSIFVD